MIDIRIKTLMGNSLNIPQKISIKEPTYYKYVREKIDKIIIRNSYTKIDYDLLANGKVMKDHMEVKIFDLERTIIDAFRYLSKEIAIKALKAGVSGQSSRKLDIKKLQQYAKKFDINLDPYILTVTTCMNRH